MAELLVEGGVVGGAEAVVLVVFPFVWRVRLSRGRRSSQGNPLHRVTEHLEGRWT